MTAPAADEWLGEGSGVFGDLTAFYAQLDGTTFMGEYEVVGGRVLLSSADFGQASAGLDGKTPEDVAARLLRGMVGAAVARGEGFMRDNETNAPGACFPVPVAGAIAPHLAVRGKLAVRDPAPDLGLQLD